MSKDDIAQHRHEIDLIDKELVELLNKRASHSFAIRSLKHSAELPLFDPKREEEILQHVEEVNSGPLYREHLREIYASILKVMKAAPSL